MVGTNLAGSGGHPLGMPAGVAIDVLLFGWGIGAVPMSGSVKPAISTSHTNWPSGLSVTMPLRTGVRLARNYSAVLFDDVLTRATSSPAFSQRIVQSARRSAISSFNAGLSFSVSC